MRDFSKEDILTVLDLTAEVKRAIHDPQYDEKVFRNTEKFDQTRTRNERKN